MSLYIPVDTKGGANFKKYEDGDVMSDALKTVRSAKDFFFPQLQDIAEFKVDGQNIEVIDKRKAAEDFVVFGVRACDAKSFEILDRVFLVEPVDSYYATRREHGIIMTMACGKPSETCFCTTFSIDASNPAGDITCWDIDGYIYMKSNTEKGSKVMAIIDSLMEDGCDSQVESKKQEIKDTLDKLNTTIEKLNDKMEKDNRATLLTLKCQIIDICSRVSRYGGITQADKELLCELYTEYVDVWKQNHYVKSEAQKVIKSAPIINEYKDQMIEIVKSQA